MANRMGIKRLTLEYKGLQENPTPYVDARPSESDIHSWYYVLTGPPDTPFEGGQYLGELRFPQEYPYKPPSIKMLTPSGRFEPGQRLCLSISDFHPESWNPAWNVSTILTGLLSFMCSKEIATGAIHSSPSRQQEYTKRSIKWNLKNDVFCSLFPDIVEGIREAVPDPNAVEFIEVIPPRPTELIQHINTRYRSTAYREAELRATDSAHAISDAAPSAAAPSSLWPKALAAISAVTVVAIAILLFKE